MNKGSEASDAGSVSPRRRSWWRILLAGFGAYLFGLVVLVLTANPNLFPTVIMLGSFLVPVAFVAFFYDHRHLSDVDMRSVVLTFLYDGVLGTFAASLLEPLFIPHLDFRTAFVVGRVVGRAAGSGRADRPARPGCVLCPVRRRGCRHPDPVAQMA